MKARTALVAATVVLLLAGEARALPPVGSMAVRVSAETLDWKWDELWPGPGQRALIFYEDRHSRHQNRALEDELVRLGQDPKVRERVAVFAVADVRAYNHWGARAVARRLLRREQRRTAAPIHADWKGAVAHAFGTEYGRSNVILIGRNGRVLFAHAGPLSPAQRHQVVQLLLAP